MRFDGGGGIRAVSLERFVSAVEGIVVAISATKFVGYSLGLLTGEQKLKLPH
jgi:hypothetical protein